MSLRIFTEIPNNQRRRIRRCMQRRYPLPITHYPLTHYPLPIPTSTISVMASRSVSVNANTALRAWRELP